MDYFIYQTNKLNIFIFRTFQNRLTNSPHGLDGDFATIKRLSFSFFIYFNKIIKNHNKL